ncbi:hypothetical protein ACLQ2R_37140 [Streptosporangium sp. DT93]|uniref:hypothetical protein n=1 Tax=Streptosporangium sp. DT93 TaxID=3393428 RepID=UPI003CFB1EDA
MKLTARGLLTDLGEPGAVLGRPGGEPYPPQPTIARTRTVLERYAEAGRSYEEIVCTGVGHSPHIERAADFAAVPRRTVETSENGSASDTAGR